MSKLILRWCLGIQDTTVLSDFTQANRFYDIIWLAKCSIVSFQKWFPNARFILFYNGDDFKKFKHVFNKIKLPLSQKLEFINQTQQFIDGTLQNPYHFIPQGVWWKWVPFRYDIDCHEISIDTDIICIGEPKEWYKWIEKSTEEIILAPERFSQICVNTCGDFYRHPILRDKLPLNCGIVGHRAGFDFSEQFFDITREIRYGYTHDSLFITEQGAINVWSYSLELQNVNTYVLSFEKCAWIRDFVYYLEKGVPVETIHATTWHKQIARSLAPILENRILKDMSDDEFFTQIIMTAKNLDYYAKHTIRRQLGDDRQQVEFYF